MDKTTEDYGVSVIHKKRFRITIYEMNGKHRGDTYVYAYTEAEARDTAVEITHTNEYAVVVEER